MDKKSKVVWVGVFMAGIVTLGLFQNPGANKFGTASSTLQSADNVSPTETTPEFQPPETPTSPTQPPGGGGTTTADDDELKQKQTAILAILNRSIKPINLITEDMMKQYLLDLGHLVLSSVTFS